MPPRLSTTSIGRAAVGVLCATFASLAAVLAFIFLTTVDVPADEGDSWVRGAIGFILFLPTLAGFLVGYYVVAAIVTYFISRSRLAGLVALAVVTSSAFAAWAAPESSDRYDLLVLASSLLLADLLLGSGVLYFIYGRRLKLAARS